MSVSKDFKIWDGFLDEWPEETAESGFSDEQHLVQDEERMKRSILAFERGTPTHEINLYSQYPLPLMVAMMSGENALSVLDFGGGIGQTYLAVKAVVENIDNLQYYILDFGARAESGKNLFKDDEKVTFIESFEEVPKKVDIVFLGSTLQYIRDWQSMLNTLSAFESNYMVFGDLVAGDIKSCVAMQNYWEHRIPVRFLNFGEVVSEMKHLGFELVFDSFYEAEILGERQSLPTSDFPEESRLEYTRNCVFKRK